ATARLAVWTPRLVARARLATAVAALLGLRQIAWTGVAFAPAHMGQHWATEQEQTVVGQVATASARRPRAFAPTRAQAERARRQSPPGKRAVLPPSGELSPGPQILADVPSSKQTGLHP